MLIEKRRKALPSSNKKKISTKDIPHYQSSVKMKILRGSYVAHCMSNCLSPNDVPLDPSMYSLKLIENLWEPIWFEGKALPDPADLSDDEIEEQDKTRNEDVEADKDDDDSSGSSMYLTSNNDGCNDPDYDPYDF